MIIHWKIKLKVNSVEITQETILKTREWFIKNSNDCIEYVRINDGVFKCNDPDGWISMLEQDKIDTANGKYDHYLGFLQKAYYIQTGNSVPLL